MLESEPLAVEECETNVENVGQEQENAAVIETAAVIESAEIKLDDATKNTETSTDGVGEIVNVQAQETIIIESDIKVDEKPVDSEEKVIEGEGSETEIESESEFDIMEEIDPSYEIDASLWKKVKDLDECDLKPEKADNPENNDKEEAKPRKKAEESAAADDEDSGYSELVVIRSEKERDQEFREYIRELCRPSIVSYLPDRVAPKGTDVRLTCTVKGNNIQTRWMKNDEVLERGQRIQTKTDGEIHSLEITQITEKDAGVYTAVFKNRAGEVETSSRVKVFDGKLHKPDHIDIALVKGE